MDSRRLKKVSSLLQETMSNILLKSGSGIYGARVLVSVSNVVVSPDLSTARFYFSIFNAADADLVLYQLQSHISSLRGELGKQLRHQLRKIPVFEFFRDDTIEHLYNINKLIEGLDIKPKDEDETAS